MISATDALGRLREGNQRFATANAERCNATSGGQHPFAIVLACSDSRVPIEAIFDQRIGDLFVVRVAGNVANAAELGSMEFAATTLGAHLIVVLGHSSCGAVQATLDELAGKLAITSPNLRSIANGIRPAIAPVLERHGGDPAAAVGDAVTANVEAVVRRLRHGSRILEDLIDRGDLHVTGAEYDLASGEVRFLDGDA